jgi:hypothetical protein
LKSVNATIITLVPKKVNPSKMGDFRPISCCNLIYKCITKILANRLVSCLGALISPNQTAFIPNRSIAENVLLAQEVMKDYHKTEGKARCTLKVDLMKAYDSVNWDFALHCLGCFGMPANFVSWIRECITSPRFSVAVNGTLVGFFEGKRGFRQGDPLSPYLFVLTMEVLSCLLAECARAQGGFGYHHRCSKIGLTHLCFADDLLIFSEASVRSVVTIQKVLNEFESLSGLKANPEKSTLFCAGVSLSVKAQIINTLKMCEGKLPVRYLGVPLISSRLRAADCDALLEKITARINSWLSKNLSFAGRLQLVASVLYSVQVYYSSIFILPKKVIRAIEQKFNRFLWNGKDEGIARAKVSWSMLCLPKKEGGLGIKKLVEWNRAAMMRHIWSLFMRAGSLWVAWVHAVLLKGRSFWQVSIPQICSWSWRKLLKLRDEARNFLSFSVGTGQNIHLWFDAWHPDGVLYEKYGHRVIYDAHSKLEARLDSVIIDGHWNWRPARSDQLVNIQSKLSLVPLGEMDMPQWSASKNGMYSCSDTWDAIRVKHPIVDWWPLVWFHFSIPKQAFIAWLAMRDALSTGRKLLCWGFLGDVKCIFCRFGVEDRDHLFFSCGFSSRIWKHVMELCGVLHPPTCWDDVVSLGLKEWRGKTMKAYICRLVFGSSIYNIWRTRNALRHGNNPWSEEQLLKQIKWEVKLRFMSKGKFRKTCGNVILCNAWGIDGILF